MENHSMEPEGARQTAEAQLEEGKRLFQRGDQTGAEALFKRIIHLAPHFEMPGSGWPMWRPPISSD